MSLTNKGRFIITVNNVNYEYKAQNINPKYESIMSENSGNSDDGVYHPFFKLNRANIEVVLPPSTASEISNVFSKVQGQEYKFTYWDILTNTERTIIAYTPSSSAKCYSGVLNGTNGMWQEATFTVIETGKAVS